MKNKEDKLIIEPKSSAWKKLFTVLGIIICIILIPALIINITLITRSYTNKDEVAGIGGYMPLISATNTMSPQIENGDLVICQKAVAGDIKEGDVIAYFEPESNGKTIVTHRVVGITNQNGAVAFVTKGDANTTNDTLLVPSENLIGVYKSKLPNMGSVAMFMQTPKGLILSVVVPMVLIALCYIIRRQEYEKAKKHDAKILLKDYEQATHKKLVENYNNLELNIKIE
jgi:signal peptidase